MEDQYRVKLTRMRARMRQLRIVMHMQASSRGILNTGDQIADMQIGGMRLPATEGRHPRPGAIPHKLVLRQD